MENKKNTGLIVLVIVLLIGLIGSVGFIVYDKVLNKTGEKIVEEKNNEIKELKTQINELNKNVSNNKSEKKQEYTYSSLAGVYKYNSDDKVILTLNENGLFYYQYPKYDIDYGILGNYTINDNKLNLNFIFEQGNDGTLSAETGSKILEISSNTILDKELDLVNRKYNDVKLNIDTSATPTDIIKMFDERSIFNSQTK